MPRNRKSSPHVDKANQRINGMASIEPNLDLGDGVSVATLTAGRDNVQVLTAEYNVLNAQLSAKLLQLTTAEKSLSGLNSKALSLAKVRFGGDSSEYEVIGGTRTSERRRRTPLPPA